jgi:integrase
MTVRFYFPRYKTKQVEQTLFCRVSEKGKELNLNTGCKANPEYWDKDKQRLNLRKVKSPMQKNLLKNINKILEAYETKILDILYSTRSKNATANFDVIVDAINKHFNKSETTFFSAYRDFLKMKSSTVSKEALQKYKRVESLLVEYEKHSGEKLSFEKISPLFFDKFFPFLTQEKDDKKMLNNTAHKTIQFFKTFMIWANERGLTENTKYKSFKSKSEQNEVVYLTNTELMILYDMIPSSDKLDRVRDIFLFQCFTGVRYSDVENLSRVDIDGAVWKLRTQKTRDIIEIPLNRYAQSILMKYHDWESPLPVISNQKMNKYIKELCEEAKINSPVKTVKFRGTERIETTTKKFEVVSSHTARRTFISLSLERGMKPDVIMSITGHKTYRMMQRYLKIADQHKKDEMDKAWGSGLRLVHK